MSGFQVGDVVVCVDRSVTECDDAIHTGEDCPQIRSIARVAKIGFDPDTGCCCPVLFLDSGLSGIAARFRKIEAPKSEISDRIRACKPADRKVARKTPVSA